MRTARGSLRPESKKLPWDAARAADLVTTFVAQRTYDEYATDIVLRSAVERQLEIVGEALVQLRRADPDTAATLPDLSRVVGMRNILIHAYAAVDDRVVWDSIARDLPTLRSALRRMLDAS